MRARLIKCYVDPLSPVILVSAIIAGLSFFSKSIVRNKPVSQVDWTPLFSRRPTSSSKAVILPATCPRLPLLLRTSLEPLVAPFFLQALESTAVETIAPLRLVLEAHFVFSQSLANL